MLTDTLAEGLSAYRIGEKIRELRLRKKIGLVELGRHTGLSPALLSKVERGRLFPTLPTLLRIALVFSVGLDYFFGGERERKRVSVVRRGERQRFPDQPGAKAPAYWFESLDFRAVERKMSAYLAEFESTAADAIRPHAHAGAEFLHVLRGRVVLTVAGAEHALDAGDSIYFDASLPHSYQRAGSARAAAIVVTVP